MIKLIAFDWNGTLLADTKAVVKATNFTFKHFGYKPIGLAQYQKTFTIPIIDFWLANGGKKEDMLNEHNIFFPEYERIIKNVRTRTGAKNTLRWLKNHHIETVIYSNHTFNEIHRELKRLELNLYIKTVLSRKDMSDQTHLLKRSKETKLADFIKKYKFKPREIISVGDTTEEVEIGRNLHLHTVAITGGENTTSRLKKAKPDFIIHNLKDLIPIIKKLNASTRKN